MSDSDVRTVRSAAEEYILYAGAVEEGHRYFYSKAMAEDILSLTDRLFTVDKLVEAARAVVAGREPCRTCGKAHELQLDPDHPGVTWSDPDDGHHYQRMHASDVLRTALSDYPPRGVHSLTRHERVIAIESKRR